jgi:hypothetical protein
MRERKAIGRPSIHRFKTRAGIRQTSNGAKPADLEKEQTMSTLLKKAIAVAAVTATLAGALAVTTTPADARWGGGGWGGRGYGGGWGRGGWGRGYGGWWGPGIIGGLALGALAYPYYGYGYPCGYYGYYGCRGYGYGYYRPYGYGYGYGPYGYGYGY